MKAIILIIGVCLIILLLAPVMAGIKDFRSAGKTEPHNVTTGESATTGTLTLSKALYDDDTAHVTITSNNTNDAAVPSSYASATRLLTVSGLVASTSRQLSVAYRYNQLDSFWGADLGAKTWPLLLGLGIIGIIVGAVIQATRKD